MAPISISSRSQAALLVLIVLQLVMVGAMFAQIEPHPPRAIALFALAPFLGVAIAIAGAALMLGGTANTAGAAMTVLAGLLALVSFGPQKWVDPAIGEIWPAVLTAEIAAAVAFYDVARVVFGRKAA